METEVENDMDEWIEPNNGDKSDVDLGDGHSLTWTEYKGQRVGGIIRHARGESPTGYCEGSIWIKGNAFNAEHK